MKKKDQEAIANLVIEMYGVQPPTQQVPQQPQDVEPQLQELRRRLREAQEGLQWEKLQGMITEEEYQTKYQEYQTKYTNAMRQLQPQAQSV
jgi:hypothetical protein